MKQFYRLMRTISLVIMVVGLVSAFMPFLGWAQEATVSAPLAPEQKLWEVFLKVLFPTLWTAVSPFVTGLITSGIKRVPPAFQVVISGVLGSLMAGAAGAIPDFPLSVESAATMGAAGGATGQMLANMNPKAMQPKTDAASQ